MPLRRAMGDKIFAFAVYHAVFGTFNACMPRTWNLALIIIHVDQPADFSSWFYIDNFTKPMGKYMPFTGISLFLHQVRGGYGPLAGVDKQILNR